MLLRSKPQIDPAILPPDRSRQDEGITRHVGIREFKDKATTLLNAGETLVIERHGKAVGFYIPVVAKDRAAGRAALDRLGLTIEEILTRTGLSEDDLVAALARDDDGP